MIIAISGPDGSGKTTQISRLVSMYEKKNKKVFVSWCRFLHLFTLFPLLLARILNLTTYEIYENGRVGFKNFSKFPLMHLYLFFLWLDYFLLHIKNFFITRFLNYDIVVYDRHVFDLLVDIYIDCRLNSIKSNFLKPFKIFIKKDINYILLLTSYEKFVNRREDLLHDHTLKKRIQIYKMLADEYKILTFDASIPPDILHSEIVKSLNEI